jgi:hypothetical protein
MGKGYLVADELMRLTEKYFQEHYQPPNTIIIGEIPLFAIREWERRDPQTRRERWKWKVAVRKFRKEYFKARNQTVKTNRIFGLNQYITGERKG